MTHFIDIARPYAKAAFLFAEENNQGHHQSMIQSIKEWQVFLESAAGIAAQEDIKVFLSNPNMSKESKLALFQEVLASYLDQHRANFLRLLNEKERLSVLPEISQLFNEDVERIEKITKVRMVTAVLPEEKFQERLTHALQRRFNTHIVLQSEIDPAILGGALLYINDAVIDISVRGQLSRLFQTLVS